MLDYVITISISAFFVPHYLSALWEPLEPLRTNPWDIIVGAVVIVVLVAINVVGVKESAGLNITLSIIDFSTQILLVIIGFALVFSPETLQENVIWGVAPSWSQFALAIPIGMIAYTGIETVSNLAEEARDPVRNVPRSYLYTAVAVFAIYFTLPAIALSALPVEKTADGDYETLLGLPPEEGGFANDPILGVVQNLGIEQEWLLHALEIYVGVLAATILFIATNAGVIGASRITYAMAGYRELPETFRRLYPKLETPWLSLVVFAGFVSILSPIPAGSTSSDMYSLAVLSFKMDCSLVVASRTATASGARLSRPTQVLLFLGRLSGSRSSAGWRRRGVDRRRGADACHSVRRAGVARDRVRRVLRLPQVGPARALACHGQGTTGFRACPRAQVPRFLVPVVAGRPSDTAMDVACRLAAERRARIVALNILEVPLDQALTDRFPDLEATANGGLDQAVAIGDSYGVKCLRGSSERIRPGRRSSPRPVRATQRSSCLELLVVT